MVVGARVYLLVSLVHGVSVGRRRVPDFNADGNHLRRLGLIRHKVGKVAALLRRAFDEIRVEKRTKGGSGLRWLERHSQNGFCVGFGEQLARCFILRMAGQGWKDQQTE
jgi:hypothetical protein